MADFTAKQLHTYLKTDLVDQTIITQKVADSLTVTAWGEEGWELGDESATGSMRIGMDGVYMTVAGFKDCCGVMVLSSLDPIYTRPPRKMIKSVIEHLARMICVGTIIYVSTARQASKIKQLKYMNFKEVSRCRNPRTGNTLITWIKVMNEVG